MLRDEPSLEIRADLLLRLRGTSAPSSVVSTPLLLGEAAPSCGGGGADAAPDGPPAAWSLSAPAAGPSESSVCERRA